MDRLGYLAEAAMAATRRCQTPVVAGTGAFRLVLRLPWQTQQPGYPRGTQVHTLASLGTDVVAALEQLCRIAVDCAPNPRPTPATTTGTVTGDLTVQGGAAIAALLPENAIISDESNTSGLMLPAATAGRPRHDVLTLTGGAIGQGLPVSD